MQLPATTAPAAIAAPFVRGWHYIEGERAATATYALLGFLFDPVFWFGLAILGWFGIWDWVLGVRLAYRTDTYDDARATNGIISKLTGFAVLGGCRALVEFFRASGLPMPAEMTVGIAGALFTGALVISEMRSISRKEIALLGHSSLEPVIQLLDLILRIKRPAPKPEGES